MQEEPVVERAGDINGWRIRSKDQMPGTGIVVTDHWLRAFGFGLPTKFNIDKILDATRAQLMGYRLPGSDAVDLLDHQAQRWGDPLSEKGSAADIELGESLGKVF